MASTRASQFAGVLWAAVAVLVGLCVLHPGVAHARNSLVVAIPDVSAQAQRALSDAKIKDTRGLYQKSRKGAEHRAKLATRTGLPQGQVDRLAAIADLCRLYKVTPRVAHLMNESGVSSIQALAGHPDAGALTEELAAMNKSRPVTENLPTKREVAGWMKDAKVLKSEDWEQTRKWASIR